MLVFVCLRVFRGLFFYSFILLFFYSFILLFFYSFIPLVLFFLFLLFLTFLGWVDLGGYKQQLKSYNNP
ncbi:hypothetical protein L933_03985 [Helicobacter pylori PZ5056]|uniref:Uncharacterized protein n=1 Tax=Helicobacter pylori PZ5056 TaxID=1337393 RepID=T2SYD7_HELPX|nr:hypothetical protein L933_03985 [Helicobacter pylori PZ5056]